MSRCHASRAFEIAWVVFAVAAVGVGVCLLAGCEFLDLPGSAVSVRNDINVVVHPPTLPPAPGCTGQLLLGAEPGTEPGEVIIEVTGGPAVLFIDGTARPGSATSGSIFLPPGTHQLVLSAGACSSNAVDVVVP